MAETEIYDDDTPRMFIFFTMFWGAVGMLVGIWVALELAFWQLNFDIPYITFGRLRPLHTNAVIFAFSGNALFASIYYSLQRLCRARLASDLLSKLHLWGWQLIVVVDALCLVNGITDGKEYAEPVWSADLLITVVWVIFAANFFLTIARRRESHLYVAIWFYLSMVITIAILHLVNAACIPVNLFKSYPIYAGIQDSLVQWWYGHNAVGFLLTTPFLGMMYYYLPKAANRPVYSYKLSIIHFWSLIFLYIWAGPHHLIYTALPDWTQTMGMVFSLMLIAPSWGGMLNGLLTLKGNYEEVRTNPVLKFFVVALSFYGMSTFEGPIMSIRSVSALSHYTDWVVGHVHSGALGWVGFCIFATFYWLVPKLYNTQLYSDKLATYHFWVGTIGIVCYITSMWITGVTQGLMWKAFSPDGTLTYNFVEGVKALFPFYVVRAVGGMLYFTGMLLCCYNLYMTSRQGQPVAVAVPLNAAHEGSH